MQSWLFEKKSVAKQTLIRFISFPNTFCGFLKHLFFLAKNILESYFSFGLWLPSLNNVDFAAATLYFVKRKRRFFETLYHHDDLLHPFSKSWTNEFPFKLFFLFMSKFLKIFWKNNLTSCVPLKKLWSKNKTKNYPWNSKILRGRKNYKKWLSMNIPNHVEMHFHHPCLYKMT